MRRDLVSPVWVPGVVARGLLRADRALDTALNLPRVSYTEQAHRAERLAEVYELRVRWWGVLARWVFSPACDLPWIFGAAIVGAGARPVRGPVLARDRPRLARPRRRPDRRRAPRVGVMTRTEPTLRRVRAVVGTAGVEQLTVADVRQVLRAVLFHGQQPPGWRDRAACAETDPALFYPRPGPRAAATVNRAGGSAPAARSAVSASPTSWAGNSSPTGTASSAACPSANDTTFTWPPAPRRERHEPQPTPPAPRPHPHRPLRDLRRRPRPPPTDPTPPLRPTIWPCSRSSRPGPRGGRHENPRTPRRRPPRRTLAAQRTVRGLHPTPTLAAGPHRRIRRPAPRRAHHRRRGRRGLGVAHRPPAHRRRRRPRRGRAAGIALVPAGRRYVTRRRSRGCARRRAG